MILAAAAIQVRVPPSFAVVTNLKCCSDHIFSLAQETSINYLSHGPGNLERSDVVT